jgi:hypothetical protein
LGFDPRRLLTDNGLSITALLTSVLSLGLSTCLSTQSLATSRQSVDLFRQANEIMLGQVRSLPQVEVSPDVMSINLESVDQLLADSPQQSITVWNSGRVAISELNVDMIAVDGLVYRIDNLLESFHRVAPARERLILREQLVPDGRAHLRIKPCMLSYIESSNIAYSNQDAKYRFIANVVVLATRFGETAPLPRSGNDSSLITVDYFPRLLAEPNAQSYLRSERCGTQVFR